MATAVNFDRPKSTVINDTAISVTGTAAEKGGAEGALAAGSSAGFDMSLKADADESGGVDIQNLFTLTGEIFIDKTTGAITLQIITTPVNGGGTNGAVVTNVITHTETMDAWQTAAGRARQA